MFIGPRKFKIPVRKGIGLEHSPASEPWMHDCIRLLLVETTGTFVDVGVNIGQTLLKVRSLSDREYIGFEPNRNCVEYAEKLIELNALPAVKLVPYGISDQDAQAQLHAYYSNAADSSASLLETFRPDSPIVHSTEVELIGPVSFAKYFHQTMSIVKVDVEGYEYFIFKGMESFIARDRPFILTEILPVYDASRADRLQRQEQLEELFRSHRYHFFRIVKSELGELSDLHQVQKIGIHGDLKDCDYLVVPEEKIEQIQSTWKI